MRNVLYLTMLFCVIFGTIGCKRIRYNDNVNYPTELVETNYPRDEQYCLMLARGITPPAQMVPVPQSYTLSTAGSGNISASGYSQGAGNFSGSGNYNYSQKTYVNNDQAALNAGMYNLGSGIMANKQRAQNYSFCMENIGWRLLQNMSQSSIEEKKTLDRRYKLYKKFKNDPMYEQVVTFMIEQARKMPEGEGLILANAWKNDPELFERDYEKARPHVEKILQKNNF